MRPRARKERVGSKLTALMIVIAIFSSINFVLECSINVKSDTAWTDSVKLSNLGIDCKEPKVAVEGNNVHVVWTDDDGGNIYYRRSTDNGWTWDSETILGNGSNPKIAVYGNNVHVLWSESYRKSDDNGTTWNTPIDMFSGLYKTVCYDLAAYGNNVYVVAVEHIDYSPYDPPYDDYDLVQFNKSSTNGDSWGSWVTIDGPNRDELMEIAMAAKNSNIHIVYGFSPYDHGALIRWFNHTYSTSGGSSWSHPDFINTGGMEKVGLSLTYNSNAVSMAWCEAAAMEYIYKIWGGGWSSNTFVASGYGFTASSQNYILYCSVSYNDPSTIYSNVDGILTVSQGHDGWREYYDVYVENQDVHFVYIHNYDVYYMHKANWPELQITSSNIEFDPPSPIENGTSVTINTTVSNTGSSTQNVDVKFYNGNPDLNGDYIPDVTANMIGNDTVDVDEGLSSVASINWIPPLEGIYEIYVWVDPDNLVYEVDDANNLASNTIVVEIPSPSPPLDLTARLSPGSKENVELIWNASVDDGSGEDDVEGYTVYKSSTGADGSYEFAAWVLASGSPFYSWLDIGAGDGDLSDYFYVVRANDTGDNEEQNTNKVGKMVSHLVKGWNLISVPLIQSNTSADYVLQTLELNYSTMQGYHAGKSRPWLHWHRGKPNYFNDEIEIYHENGYYIDMVNSDYLVVTGRVPINSQIQLKAGWNLVGYPSPTTRTRDDALSSISGSYNKVEFFSTIKGKEEAVWPLDDMNPKLGYWVHVTADCMWAVQ
ncbi:MAG: hypothetical protein JSW00_09225 [Thermoplasmata archaeon]|nr:MAG: hypothetical protein JSW00_09225 [Thermoplasmata archaeon]